MERVVKQFTSDELRAMGRRARCANAHGGYKQKKGYYTVDPPSPHRRMRVTIGQDNWLPAFARHALCYYLTDCQCTAPMYQWHQYAFQMLLDQMEPGEVIEVVAPGDGYEPCVLRVPLPGIEPYPWREKART